MAGRKGAEKDEDTHVSIYICIYCTLGGRLAEWAAGLGGGLVARAGTKDREGEGSRDGGKRREGRKDGGREA